MNEFTYDMSGFSQGMAALKVATGETMQTIIKKETGELIKMLVKLSPPRSMSKSVDAIRHNANMRFNILSRDDARSFVPAHSGPAQWYFSNEKYLYGVSRGDLDLRRGPAERLAAMLGTHKAKSRGQAVEILPFKDSRPGGQKVRLTSAVTTTRPMVSAAIKLIQKQFGKLKASWLVAVAQGKIQLTGGMIPSWVSRHASNARGRAKSNLTDKNSPWFEISSFATAVGSAQMRRAIPFALNARIESMRRNSDLFTRGIKHLGDYTKGAATRGI